MKSIKLLFVAITVMMFSAAHSLFAQQCYITYTPDLSSYTNVTADDTNIYTTVGVDGSGVMTTSGSCPNLSSIYHYSILLNGVGSVSSGWVSGSQTCPDCYISDEQDEELPYDPTATYTFDWEADVSCSVAGTFFSTSANQLVGVRTTYWGPPPVPHLISCDYTNLACSAGTTPTCTSGIGLLFSPSTTSCPNYAESLNVVIDGQCIGFAFNFAAIGPGPCN